MAGLMRRFNTLFAMPSRISQLAAMGDYEQVTAWCSLGSCLFWCILLVFIMLLCRGIRHRSTLVAMGDHGQVRQAAFSAAVCFRVIVTFRRAVVS